LQRFSKQISEHSMAMPCVQDGQKKALWVDNQKSPSVCNVLTLYLALWYAIVETNQRVNFHVKTGLISQLNILLSFQ